MVADGGDVAAQGGLNLGRSRAAAVLEGVGTLDDADAARCARWEPEGR